MRNKFREDRGRGRRREKGRGKEGWRGGNEELDGDEAGKSSERLDPWIRTCCLPQILIHPRLTLSVK